MKRQCWSWSKGEDKLRRSQAERRQNTCREMIKTWVWVGEDWFGIVEEGIDQ